MRQRRVFTIDRESAVRSRTRDFRRNSSGVFAPEQIGTTRYRTPEGFLFCEDVPIARLGEMVYGPDEIPIPGSSFDGFVRITRDSDQLFREETMSSFQGKPITNDHPASGYDVSPTNWRELACGTVLNPRRGTGQFSDCIVADFLVTDADAIESIESGKKEVSCGYDANYLRTGDGRGIQTDIIGNHVALVDRGRCGQRCSIGDHHTQEDDDMKTRDNANPAGSTATLSPTEQRIRRAFTDAADVAVAEAAKGDSAVHVHLHQGAAAGKAAATTDADPLAASPTIQGLVTAVAGLVKTVDKQGKVIKGLLVRGRDADKDDEDDEEGEGKKEASTGDGEDDDKDDEKDKDKGTTDGKPKIRDSAALSSSYQEVAAGVEILVPGLGMPTFDAKRERKATVDCMCNARKRALDRFSMLPHGAAIVASVNGGKTFDSLAVDCKATAAVFKAAVAAQAAANNGASTRDAYRLPAAGAGQQYVPGSVVLPPPSGDEMNARNRAFWKERGVSF